MNRVEANGKLHSFAFVEYEDRRDADDAYHDMHNKRIGRDDILKIEVSSRQQTQAHDRSLANYNSSGLALPHLLLGASTVATVSVVLAAVTALPVAALLAPGAAPEITLPGRMIVVTATATVIMSVTAAILVTALAAPSGRWPHTFCTKSCA